MRLTIPMLSGLMLVLSCGIANAAPKDELHDAFVKFLQVKSFRATITDLKKGEQVSSMEFVAPDRFRMKTADGMSQLIIGDAMYMDMNGQMMRMPVPGVAKLTSQYRNEAFLRQATYVAVNDYEGKVHEQKTGRSLDDIARGVKGLVYTQGSKGSLIFAGGQRHEIPCVKADEVVDPTGCGDAYRAGLLYGISRGWDWPSTGRLGSLLGAIKIGYRGAQNHAPSQAELETRFRAAFGYSPWKG
jgi:hypothetical protein